MPTAPPHPALTRFAASRDEADFVAVVEEFSGLVFTSALRRTGDRQLAEEIAQNVFAIVARKAKRLAVHPSLTAWFYTTVKLESAKALRTRQRHQRRIEALAEEMKSHTGTMTAAEQQNWRDALPLLDESLDRLSPAEREVVLGRFFEQHSFKEIAGRSGSSEAACKMRLKRTLGKLNSWLTGRGVTLSATALATALTAEFSKAAPAAVSAALPSSAIAASSSVSSATILTNTLNTMSSAKTGALAVAAVLLIASFPFAAQQAEINELRGQRSNRPNAVHSQQFDIKSAAASTRAPMAPLLAEFSKPLTVDQLLLKKSGVSFLHDIGDHYRLELHLASLSESERQELVEALRAHPSPEAGDLAISIERDLPIGPDPGAKFDRMLDDGIRVSNLGGGLSNWAKLDPEAAIAWFESRREAGKLVGKGTESDDADESESDLRQSLFLGALEVSPETAFELLSGVSKKERLEAFGDVGWKLVHQDRADLFEWIGSLSDPEERAAAATGAVRSFLDTDGLEGAAEFLHRADLDASGMAKGLSRMFEANPHRSLPWLEKIGFATRHADEDAYEKIYDSMVFSAQYYEHDDGLSEWLDSLPAGKLRDVALTSSSRALAHSPDEQAAIEQAQRIEDHATREKAIGYVIEELSEWNREAAEKLAEEHGYQLEPKPSEEKE